MKYLQELNLLYRGHIEDIGYRRKKQLSLVVLNDNSNKAKHCHYHRLTHSHLYPRFLSQRYSIHRMNPEHLHLIILHLQFFVALQLNKQKNDEVRQISFLIRFIYQIKRFQSYFSVPFIFSVLTFRRQTLVLEKRSLMLREGVLEMPGTMIAYFSSGLATTEPRITEKGSS